MKNKIHLLPLLIGFLLTLLGHISVDEYGGFDKTTNYWWFWIGCMLIPVITSFLIWEDNQD